MKNEMPREKKLRSPANSNYRMWRADLMVQLTALGLLMYMVARPAPGQPGRGTDAQWNPHTGEHAKAIATTIANIDYDLTRSTVIAQMTGKTLVEILELIESMYRPQTEHLLSQLTSLKYSVKDTVDTFIMRATDIFHQLREMDPTALSLRMFVQLVLDAMPEIFAPILTQIRASPLFTADPINLDGITGILRDH